MMSKIHIDRGNWIGKITVFGMLFLLLFSLSTSLFPLKAYAQNTNSPTAEATLYETMHFLIACGDGEGRGWHSGNSDSISGEDLNNGRLYDNNSKDIAIGYLAERNAENGQGACNGINSNNNPDVKAACDTIGLSCLDFVLKANIYFNEANGGYDLYNEDDSKRSQKIVDFFKKRYPDFNFEGDMRDSAKYFNWKATFLKECADGDPRTGGPKKVKIVDEKDGSSEDKEYNLKAGANELKPVGKGMGVNNNEGKYTCDEIIEGMRTSAPAAEKAQKDFIAKGGKEDTKSETGDKPNCESQAKLSTAWIICAFLDTVDAILIGNDKSPGLIGIVESLLNVNEEQYNNNQLKASWSYFRSIATFLLILVALVMIIGQAISKE